jgi:Concanavalin A-like lectin/glucanases superfamily
MPDITTGLVLYYPFDTSLTADASGSGNTGTAENSPTLTTGIINNAISLNGTNQLIDAGIPSSLDLHTANAFTLACWAYPTSIPNGVGIITKDYTIFGNGTVQYELGFSMDTGSTGLSIPGVGFYDGTWRFCYRSSGANVPLNAWIHMVGTWDGTSLKLYINGSLDQTTTPGSALPTITTNHTFIGRRHDNTLVTFFPGLLDDARIYNRALTAADVGMLFTFGNKRKGLLF